LKTDSGLDVDDVAGDFRGAKQKKKINLRIAGEKTMIVCEVKAV
jgi:hypothetical protein